MLDRIFIYKICILFVEVKNVQDTSTSMEKINIFYIDRLAIEAANFTRLLLNLCILFNKVLMYTFNSQLFLNQ